MERFIANLQSSFPDKNFLRRLTFASTFLILTNQCYAQNPFPQKRAIQQFLAPSCAAIASNSDRFPSRKIKKATQYFTPLFHPGPDGKLREKDRRDCLNVEGACLVGDYLYNHPNTQGVKREEINYKFGKGNLTNEYNLLNSLDPCRTIAADQRREFYPIGTVIFIPVMRGKICPQSGKPVDGCFIVGDVGSAIKGEGRFDIFTGECAHYSKKTNDCSDPDNAAFVAPKQSKFFIIDRANPLAVQLRQETDEFIQRDWQ